MKYKLVDGVLTIDEDDNELDRADEKVIQNAKEFSLKYKKGYEAFTFLNQYIVSKGATFDYTQEVKDELGNVSYKTESKTLKKGEFNDFCNKFNEKPFTEAGRDVNGGAHIYSICQKYGLKIEEILYFRDHPDDEKSKRIKDIIDKSNKEFCEIAFCADPEESKNRTVQYYTEHIMGFKKRFQQLLDIKPVNEDKYVAFLNEYCCSYSLGFQTLNLGKDSPMGLEIVRRTNEKLQELGETITFDKVFDFEFLSTYLSNSTERINSIIENGVQYQNQYRKLLLEANTIWSIKNTFTKYLENCDNAMDVFNHFSEISTDFALSIRNGELARGEFEYGPLRLDVQYDEVFSKENEYIGIDVNNLKLSDEIKAFSKKYSKATEEGVVNMFSAFKDYNTAVKKGDIQLMEQSLRNIQIASFRYINNPETSEKFDTEVKRIFKLAENEKQVYTNPTVQSFLSMTAGLYEKSVKDLNKYLQKIKKDNPKLYNKLGKGDFDDSFTFPDGEYKSKIIAAMQYKKIYDEVQKNKDNPNFNLKDYRVRISSSAVNIVLNNSVKGAVDHTIKNLSPEDIEVLSKSNIQSEAALELVENNKYFEEYFYNIQREEIAATRKFDIETKRNKVIENIKRIQSVIPEFSLTEEQMAEMISEDRELLHNRAKRLLSKEPERQDIISKELAKALGGKEVNGAFARNYYFAYNPSENTVEKNRITELLTNNLNRDDELGFEQEKKQFLFNLNAYVDCELDKLKDGMTELDFFNFAEQNWSKAMMAHEAEHCIVQEANYGIKESALYKVQKIKNFGVTLGDAVGRYREYVANDLYLTFPAKFLTPEQYDKFIKTINPMDPLLYYVEASQAINKVLTEKKKNNISADERFTDDDLINKTVLNDPKTVGYDNRRDNCINALNIILQIPIDNEKADLLKLHNFAQEALDSLNNMPIYPTEKELESVSKKIVEYSTIAKREFMMKSEYSDSPYAENKALYNIINKTFSTISGFVKNAKLNLEYLKKDNQELKLYEIDNLITTYSKTPFDEKGISDFNTELNKGLTKIQNLKIDNKDYEMSVKLNQAEARINKYIECMKGAEVGRTLNDLRWKVNPEYGLDIKNELNVYNDREKIQSDRQSIKNRNKLYDQLSNNLKLMSEIAKDDYTKRDYESLVHDLSECLYLNSCINSYNKKTYDDIHDSALDTEKIQAGVEELKPYVAQYINSLKSNNLENIFSNQVNVQAIAYSIGAIKESNVDVLATYDQNKNQLKEKAHEAINKDNIVSRINSFKGMMLESVKDAYYELKSNATAKNKDDFVTYLSEAYYMHRLLKDSKDMNSTEIRDKLRNPKVSVEKNKKIFETILKDPELNMVKAIKEAKVEEMVFDLVDKLLEKNPTLFEKKEQPQIQNDQINLNNNLLQ